MFLLCDPKCGALVMYDLKHHHVSFYHFYHPCHVTHVNICPSVKIALHF